MTVRDHSRGWPAPVDINELDAEAFRAEEVLRRSTEAADALAAFIAAPTVAAQCAVNNAISAYQTAWILHHKDIAKDLAAAEQTIRALTPA